MANGATVARNARYVYRCAQCGGPVSKPAVFTPKKGVDGDGKRATAKAIGLGGWKCQNGCKPCKVERKLRKGDE